VVNIRCCGVLIVDVVMTSALEKTGIDKAIIIIDAAIVDAATTAAICDISCFCAAVTNLLLLMLLPLLLSYHYHCWVVGIVVVIVIGIISVIVIIGLVCFVIAGCVVLI
jgi:hypothetical protein